MRGEVNSSVIKVVSADDSPQNVSYIFQEIPNNITVSKDYVYFSMSHFSGVKADTSIKSRFCGTLLSRDSPKGKNMWDYNFVIHQCGLTTNEASSTHSLYDTYHARMYNVDRYVYKFKLVRKKGSNRCYISNWQYRNRINSKN